MKKMNCYELVSRILLFTVLSVGVITGKTSSRSRYIDYYEGTLNVILAAPHGGLEKPYGMPDRDAGCWDLYEEECIWNHNCGTKNYEKCKATIVKDLNTQDLILLLRDAIHDEMGEYPYVIVNKLHRTKLDANRDKDQATFGVPTSEDAWDEFHRLIDYAKAEIGGPGIFFDIHGHGHVTNWAELGYLVNKRLLNSGDFGWTNSSIRNLASQSNIEFHELLRGRQSFGTFLEEQGFSAVPSGENPSPGEKKFFCGGYNTRRHGSWKGGQIDAIQIESSRIQRSDEVRPRYAKALAKAMKKFVNMHYRGIPLNEGTMLNSVSVKWIVIPAIVVLFRV